MLPATKMRGLYSSPKMLVYKGGYVNSECTVEEETKKITKKTITVTVVNLIYVFLN